MGFPDKGGKKTRKRKHRSAGDQRKRKRRPAGDRRKRKRLLLAALLLVLALPVLPNLLFLTSPGRALAEKKLSRRLGLPVKTQALSWSPWNGFQARGITLGLPLESSADPNKKPPPLVTVQRLQALPYWGSLLSSRPRFREIRVENPEGALPAEHLLRLMRRQGATLPAPEKPEPKPQPAPAPEKPPVPPKKTDPKKPPVKKPTHPAPEKPARPPAGKPSRLVITEGRLTLYSLEKKFPPLTFHGLHLDLPLSGPDATGRLSCRSLTLDGKEIAARTALPLEWKRPHLLLPKTTLQNPLLPLSAQGQLRAQAPFPFRLTLKNIPSQKPLHLQWKETHLTTTTRQPHLQASLQGTLRNPLSWRGTLLAQAQRPSLTHLKRGTIYEFDNAQLAAILANGTLQIHDFRLLSPDLSLLANAHLLPTLEANATIRMVISPQKNNTAHFLWRTRMIPRHKDGPFCSPLGTPDRLYRDFRLHLPPPPRPPLVNLGPDHTFVPLHPILRRIEWFIRNEDHEEFLEPDN